MTPWDRIRWAVRSVPTSQPVASQVLTLLVAYANDAGEAWPSQRTLAQEVWPGPTTKDHTERVRKAVRWLTEAGLVEVDPNARLVGDVMVNVYRLTFRPPVTTTGARHDNGAPHDDGARHEHEGPPVTVATDPPSSWQPTPRPGDGPNIQVNPQTNPHSTSTPVADRFSRGAPAAPEAVSGSGSTSGSTGKSSTSGSYRHGYNKRAQRCGLCQVWVDPGGGVLLRAQDGTLCAVHHLGECAGRYRTTGLSEAQTEAHLAGRVPVPEDDDSSVIPLPVRAVS